MIHTQTRAALSLPLVAASLTILMLHASQHVYALMISSTAWQLRPYLSSPSALWWFFFPAPSSHEKHKEKK